MNHFVDTLALATVVKPVFSGFKVHGSFTALEWSPPRPAHSAGRRRSTWSRCTGRGRSRSPASHLASTGMTTASRR